MAGVEIRASDDGFLVFVSGNTSEALVARRLVSQLSNDPPGDPRSQRVSYYVPRARIKSLLLSLAPHLGRTDMKLKRDDAVESVLAEVAAEISQLHGAFQGRLAPAKFELTTQFKRPLREHQVRAVAKLLVLPHGANFSVPGAGKTTVTLALHDALRQRGAVDQLFVIAPRNAFGPWEDEVRECLDPAPRVVRLAGGEDRIVDLLNDPENANAIFLVSYQQTYFALEAIERWLVTRERVHLVLDESHKVKNPRRGAWGATVLRLASLVARRDILTGTPAPNAIEDLGTQLSFLWPFQTIVSDADLRNPAAERTLTERLRPLYVRTTKKDLGLPKTETRRVPVAMGSIQAQIHERVMLTLARSTDRHGPMGPDVFAQLRKHVIRLLQLASNPALVLTAADEFRVPPLDFGDDEQLDELFARYNEVEIPPKFAYAVKKVRERAEAGLKTVVWSGFVRNLEMLAKLVPEFEPVVLHGGIPTALDMDEAPENSRERLVEKFKEDERCRVMIANPAACSESISLHHVCHFALYLDRTFNAASFLQSMDRIHRLGLAKTAHIEYELLVSPATIDQIVDRRLGEKIRRLGRLLDDEGLSTIDLDTVDEDSSVAFDEEDAREVIAFLSERIAREQ